MTALRSQSCVPCRGGEPPLPEKKVVQYLEELPAWKVVEVEGVKRLTRTFSFPDFLEALRFTNQVGEMAEEVDHHPQLVTAWGEVRVSWWTYVIDGLHRNDFIMAARTDHLYER